MKAIIEAKTIFNYASITTKILIFLEAIDLDGIRQIKIQDPNVRVAGVPLSPNWGKFERTINQVNYRGSEVRSKDWIHLLPDLTPQWINEITYWIETNTKNEANKILEIAATAKLLNPKAEEIELTIVSDQISYTLH